MTTIGIILTGAVFFALGGAWLWAMCAMAAKGDRDIGAKARRR